MVFRKAYDNTVKVGTIVNAFHASGIFPVNFAAIHSSKLNPSSVYSRIPPGCKGEKTELCSLSLQLLRAWWAVQHKGSSKNALRKAMIVKLMNFTLYGPSSNNSLAGDDKDREGRLTEVETDITADLNTPIYKACKASLPQ